MINRSNYEKTISEFGIENLDPILRTQHDNYLTIQEFYNDDEGIKQTIDLYFRKLEKFISKFKQAEAEKIVQKETPKIKAEPLKKEPAARKARSRKPAEPKKTKVTVNKKSGRKVKHLSEEVKVIRKFVGLHGKQKTPESILSFIRSLQRSLTKGLISKKSSLIKWIAKIESALIQFYNTMNNSDIIKIPEKVLAQLVALAGGENVYRSIPIISYYIGLKGKQPDGIKLDRFVSRVEKAISSGNVRKDDPYLNTVKGIVKKLKKYKSGGVVEIDKAELNGLEGIINACGCRQDLGKIYDTKGKPLRKCKKKTYSDAKKGACSHNKGLAGLGEAMTAEQIAKMDFVLLPFTGIWKNLFGQPEKNFSMMFHGEPGAGKSTFLMKFAKFLSGLGSVLYITSEEFGSVTLRNLVNAYLNPLPGNIVFAPNLDSIKPGDFDFVIFDSITDAGLKLEDYKKLKAKNPETAFILVLQHTKDGQFKGGKEWEHEAQVVGKIVQGNIDIYKNRYGVKNSWYFFDKPKEAFNN